jgi:hypothetical protein
MSTSAQILANQQNAKLSTGPSTPAGKAVSSSNATKHGLCSGFTVLPDESQEEYDHSLESYRHDFGPVNEHEDFLVTQMVQSKWKLARVNRMEAELVTVMMEADPDHKTAAAVIAAAMLKGTAKPYQTLQRYAVAAERAYFRALRELERGRKAQPTADPLMALVMAPVSPQNAEIRNEPNFPAPENQPQPSSIPELRPDPALVASLRRL